MLFLISPLILLNDNFIFLAIINMILVFLKYYYNTLLNRGDYLNSTANPKLKGYILTVIGAISWGFSGTCGQYLMNIKHVESAFVANIRLLSAGLILILISILKDRKNTFTIFKNKKDRITLIIFGLFGMLANQFSYLQAIHYTNAPTATVMQFLSSILIVIGMCFIEKRFPQKREITSISLAVFGIFTLATHLNIHKLVITTSGLFWGFSAAFAVVIYSILPINILKKYSSIVVTGFGMLIGGIFLTIIVKPWNINVDFDVMTILALLAIIIIGTIFAFTCFLAGVSIIGPIKGSLIAGLEAISALLFSMILLNESFKPMDLIGMAAILVAVSILSISKE